MAIILSLRTALACAVTLTVGVVPVLGENFLGASRRPPTQDTHVDAHSADLQAAMGSVLGCGNDAADPVNSSRIEQSLKPMWDSLPKKQGGRVEWRQLRYLSHRYFMQQSSLLIRGFEPSTQVSPSQLGAAGILHERFPALTDMLLEGHQAERGYSMQDAVALVATLEHLIHNSEHALLEKVFSNQGLRAGDALSTSQMQEVLKQYVIHWMMGDGLDESTLKVLTRNRTLLEINLPHWPEIEGFVEGIVKSMAFAWQHGALQPGRAGQALQSKYRFEDASTAVGDLTRSFASYWETECQAIKTSLVKMDSGVTGRISLSDFYSANMDGEWRFGESEAYLRELGALDESSTWRGPQVIIPNYLQAASNCIVSRPHYHVCCVNECEDILGDIERSVGAPSAHPDVILQLVGNVSNFNDEAARLDRSLRGQLQRIADTHGGQVPLHGRLFAQWLHYVFPRECPFPHKAGATSSLTPKEYGGDFAVTQDEVERAVHSSSQRQANADLSVDDQWMSQWSEEEELIGDYSAHMSTPWPSRHGAYGGAFFFLGLLILTKFRGKVDSQKQRSVIDFGFEPGKAHWV